MPLLVPARNDGSLLHLRQRAEPALHFRELDAVPPYFDLSVQTAQKFQIPIRQPAHEIPGPVCPLPRHERVRNEFLGGQIRPIHIFPGQSVSPDVQLSRHPDRLPLPPAVQDADPRVVHGPADRHAAPLPHALIHRVRRREHGRLRRPVSVGYPVRPQIFQRLHDMLLRARLSAEEELPHMLQTGYIPIHDGIEQSRRHEGRSNALLLECPRQLPGVQHAVLRQENQRRPVQQRSENLIRRAVKSIIGQLEHPILGQHLHKSVADAGFDHIPVRNHHAFGRAGRTGCVHDISRGFRRNGQVLHRRPRPGFRPRPLVQRQRDAREAGHGHAVLREQDPGAAILQHLRKPLGRKARIQRHIRRARGQNPEDGLDHPDRTVRYQSDRFSRADSPLSEPIGQTLRPLAQLPIGDLFAAPYERRMIRTKPRLLREQLRNARLARIIRRSALQPEQLKPLSLGDQLDIADARRLLFRHLAQNMLIMHGHSPDGGMGKDLGIVFDRHQNLIFLFQPCPGHVELRAVKGRLLLLNKQARQFQLGDAHILQHEQCIKERMPARISGQVHMLQQFL